MFILIRESSWKWVESWLSLAAVISGGLAESSRYYGIVMAYRLVNMCELGAVS